MSYLFMFMFVVCWGLMYVESVRRYYVDTPYVEITSYSCVYAGVVVFIGYCAG
jgi:hypothetical protein